MCSKFMCLFLDLNPDLPFLGLLVKPKDNHPKRKECFAPSEPRKTGKTAKSSLKTLLGGRFEYSLFFSARGGEGGSPRRQEGGGSIFY